MSKDMTPPQPNEKITEILRNIPRSDHDAADLDSLMPTNHQDEGSTLHPLVTTIAFLEALGAVRTIRSENDSSVSVKASTQTGYYFLRSIAEYMESGVPIVDEWKRGNVSTDSPHPRPLDFASQLLYLLEQRRLEQCLAPNPIRDVSVSQAIIKARLRWSRQPVFLVQYDRTAQQYQMIGGRMRPADRDTDTVMRRELAEELPKSSLVKERRYELQELAVDLEHTGLSPTFGAYTKYLFTFYQVKFEGFQLDLGDNDRWVSLEEIKTGKTRDGMRIANDITTRLDECLPGGLVGLGLSLDKRQALSIARILKERPWEITGILVSALGLLLAIIFFIIQMN